MRKKKRVKRASTFKSDFKRPGPNAKKHFQTFMTRYGVRGYKLGLARHGQEFDFYFHTPEMCLGVFVGQEPWPSHTVKELLHRSVRLIFLGEEMDSDWFEAIAQILHKAPEDIRPKHPWLFTSAAEFEGPRLSSPSCS